MQQEHKNMGIEAKPMAAENNSGRGDKRRKLIFRALHQSIIKKGYAKTTLADIAESEAHQ